MSNKRKYAEDTKVPVSRSKAHIEYLVRRYGSSDIGLMEFQGKIVVMFYMAERNVRFMVKSPDTEQERRSIYRALLLTIKAKLESAERGIETFDEAFLGQIVLPNKQTVSQQIIPNIESAYQGNDVPLLPDYSSQPTLNHRLQEE